LSKQEPHLNITLPTSFIDAMFNLMNFYSDLFNDRTNLFVSDRFHFSDKRNAHPFLIRNKTELELFWWKSGKKKTDLVHVAPNSEGPLNIDNGKIPEEVEKLLF
jgi:hypothetical protein